MTDTSWQNRVTLLVNSCDAYADMWQPFFTLLPRYFVPRPAEILLTLIVKVAVRSSMTNNSVPPSDKGQIPHAKESGNRLFLNIYILTPSE